MPCYDLGVLLGLLLKRKLYLSDASSRTRLIAVATVLVGQTALFAYYYTIQHGNQAIVTPIAGSYPALFALLSFWFYKDRLSKLQIAGLF
jgi:drug/metabolite transporter (DMT)-like permease